MPSVTLNLSEQLSEEVKPYSRWLPAILELGLLTFTSSAHETVRDLIAFLKSNPSAQAVHNYRLSAESQARLTYLLARNREAVLSEAEAIELEDYMKLEHVVRMIKAGLRADELALV